MKNLDVLGGKGFWNVKQANMVPVNQLISK